MIHLPPCRCPYGHSSNNYGHLEPCAVRIIALVRATGSPDAVRDVSKEYRPGGGTGAVWNAAVAHGYHEGALRFLLWEAGYGERLTVEGGA